MAENQRRIHPLMAIAAIAIVVFSAVGVGVMTGVIPGSSSKEASTGAPIAVTETPAVKPAVPATKETTSGTEAAPAKHATAPKAPAHPRKAPPVEQQQVAQAPERAPAAKPAAVCAECGIVDSVDVKEQEGQATGLGAVAGGVAGGLVGSQFGKGTGKTVATVAGVAGGAYAGHQVEKHVKSSKQWNIRVRMEDGSTRTVTQDSEPAFRSGDPVKIVDGRVLAR